MQSPVAIKETNDFDDHHYWIEAEPPSQYSVSSTPRLKTTKYQAPVGKLEQPTTIVFISNIQAPSHFGVNGLVAW